MSSSNEAFSTMLVNSEAEGSGDYGTYVSSPPARARARHDTTHKGEAETYVWVVCSAGSEQGAAEQ
jgi:hypothetical protein